ncbi:MAG: hypothetical protein IT319_05075 [Anaerolineae bacterium]|nr:hypothetical protein [Anaerolineae bacterium]
MPSIFAEEWRDCLRAHYTYVVRMGDQGTERTLRNVMFEAGFGEDEVKELYVLATAHVDDVGAGFVPDMEIFEEGRLPVGVVVPEMPEAVEREPLPDEVAAELEPEADEPEAADDEEDSPPPEPDVTQLSLF